MSRRYTQLDVFSAVATQGNPLAVVHDAEGLSEAQMAAFARWTNLSETTFLLPPTDSQADYRVRIFTPQRELPFAGHPTLGSAAAWLAAGGQARTPGLLVQECAVGLIRVRQDQAVAAGRAAAQSTGAALTRRLAFAAPPCRRTGPLEDAVLAQICDALQLQPTDIVDHHWVDNGPGWSAVRLASAPAVLALRPDWQRLAGLHLGVVGPWPDGHPTQFEVRALIGATPGYEDPVTGSLNASLAQWLIGSGVAPERYVAAQGTALGRAGRVQVDRDAQDPHTIWIGGDVSACISGTVAL